jgi:hypothetical protein
MAVVALPTGEERVWLGTFGERWFQTLCATAGCSSTKLEPDRTGTDFVVHDHDREVIRVQVKATTAPDVVGEAFRFPLDVRTYDRLRGGTTPGYLVLVVVLRRHPGWIGLWRKGSVVRAAMYWLSLAGLPGTPNVSSVTMSLPFGNMLTPEALLGLFPKGGGADGTAG